MAKSSAKAKQLELDLQTHGGRREGAGRRRVNARATVPHTPRPRFRKGYPIEITLRLCEGLPCLRERPTWAVVVRVFRSLRELVGFRVVHYSVQGNHIHAIVEADSREAFVAGMRCMTIRLARRLNTHFGRKGKLLDHRYHARALGSPQEVFYALQYVLLNARKHHAQRGEVLPPEWIDPRSTAICFDGWATPLPLSCVKDFGTSLAQTWLLRVGWRKLGLLRLDAIPGGRAPATKHLPAAA